MKKKIKKESKDYLKLLPIALILAIVPLIIYMKKIVMTPDFAKLWKGLTEDADFFSYYKMAWFIGLTGIAVLFYCYYILTKKIEITFPKIFIPLGIYLLFVFLSSSFSDFHTQAFFGFPDRYEGFFTILCYVLICFVASVLVSSEFDIKYLMYFLGFCVLILSVIGIAQFFGKDILQSAFGKNLILPKDFAYLSDTLDFKFPKNFIYSTLYNPNYVGGYFSIILSICLVIFLAVDKLKFKIISGVFCILSFINLVGSLSMAGTIGFFAAGIVLLIYMRKYFRKNIIAIIIILACFISTTLFMNYTSEGKVFHEFNIAGNMSYSSIKQDIMAMLSKEQINNKQGSSNTLMLINVNHSSKTIATVQQIGNNNQITDKSGSPELVPAMDNTSLATSTDSGNVKNIMINKNTLTLNISDNYLNIKFDPSSSMLSFTDTDNKSLEVSTKEDNNLSAISIKDPRFDKIRISSQGNIVIVEAPNTAFRTIITQDGFKFLTPSGNITDMVEAESFGFKDKEQWGSYRGYIWSRSIPLLKDTILLGHGPDTFALVFPQNDYVAKMKYVNDIYLYVDKPHNFYLQVGINSGILSLLALLAFIGWYYFSSLRMYIKGAINKFFIPGVACLVGVTSFLVSSLANDSTVSVSPIFWILIGTGIACNRLFKAHTA